MSQNTIHPVSFKTNVVNAKEIQPRDYAKKGHHKGSNGSPTDGSPPSSSSTTMPATDNGVTYLASVGVGSPATPYSLLIDTGSSNTWISAVTKPYNQTSTSKQISYGKGSCSGGEYTDQVTLGLKLVIKDQSIGVADKADDMDGMDGILGIGLVCLTKGNMAPDVSNPDGTPTVIDSLLRQNLISNECIGIYYEPTTSANAPNGCLSFGGPDPSKYTGELNYVPITKKSPACNYWGIEQSISYGSTEIMAQCAGISDTGTTLVMFPDSVLESSKEATGAVDDPFVPQRSPLLNLTDRLSETGLLTVTEDQYNGMQSMFFNIGGVKCELTKNAQIFPRSMNSTIGAPDGKICLIFASMGDIQAGDGLCFITDVGHRRWRFYSVYDTTNSQVGYATTRHTMATTN
ncbi:aspartic peptidase domain-containing protein [Mycena epipterygia]|nr:aspartic peptidase domain-containing protein [Mycena epipterygia]